MRNHASKHRFLLALAGTLTAISGLLCSPLAADDRDILRDSSSKPYVFILLDTSGSMNWSPRCTSTQFAAGECNFLCPTGDCKVPRDGDDVNSKFRQAKEGLYEVLKELTEMDIGFATYNADDLGVGAKHWIYRVDATQPAANYFTLSGTVTFPVAGTDEVFGAQSWDTRGGTCVYAPNTYNDTTDDNHIGCFPRRQDPAVAPDDNDCENGGGANTNVCAPADTNNAWEYGRFRRLPRLGVGGNQTTYFYLRVPNGTRYRVKYSGAVALGTSATITVAVETAQCTNNKCTTVTGAATRNIRYTRVSEFVAWENTTKRADPQMSFLGTGFRFGQDSTAGNLCAGWDPNDDTPSDDTGSGATAINLKQRTATGTVAVDGNPPAYFIPTVTADLPHAWRFQYGDVIPLSWTSANTQLVLNRLAPRIPAGGDPALDPEAFSTSTYLRDIPSGAETYLRPKSDLQKPLVPAGSTPIRNSIQKFRAWYRGCGDSTACVTGTGWDDFAATRDPNWGCRKKYLLVITDGDETCSSGGTPANCHVGFMTEALHNYDEVDTFVVGYGVDSTTDNQLNCMAARGGTVAPYYPQNKTELVEALRSAFDQIREETAAFASAAVPQVQANATDKIFLSSFTPMKEVGFWAGRMDSFLKPLPIDANGRPDRTELCDADTRASCFLWDAGDVQEGQRGTGAYAPRGLLLQAPHPDDVDTTPPFDPTELQLGTDEDERRVLYSQFSEPGNRKLFTYPATNAQKYDLWTGMGIGFIVGDTASETAADNRANTVITTALLEKEGDIPDPDDDTLTIPITYLLGDVFHADPLVVNKPSDFTYYTGEPYLNKALCGIAADPDRGPRVSYRAFADRNVCRRTVLFTAANDGQLHAFDAGIFRAPLSGTAECLLPAKDLDGDGDAETDEFPDGVIDYDEDDAVESVDEHVIDGAYDNGTGKEIFSFIPRAMLVPVRKLVEEQDRNKGPWGIDGSPRVDDVFIDPSAAENGTTACTSREWRTVLVGGYREGGPGYYALDITQPDTLSSLNVPEPANTYTPSCFDGNANCDSRPYPSVLWEFQDRQSVQVSAGIFVTMDLDEDLNNERDLGNTWSKAATGRIRVCTGACSASETEDRFVAIFGGGLGNDPTEGKGNFVYMVDIETGKTIYKKAVIGSIPADVAAVDSNGDTYLDRLYFGTTAGFIYKVQLETSALTPMRLLSQTFQTRNASVNYNFTTERLVGPTGDGRKYDPFQLFSTGGRSIYQEVTAIYVASEDRVALAVGTGNRWNLWEEDGQEGRFYMLLDNNFVDTDRDGVLNIVCTGCTQPLTESKYQAIAVDDPNDPLTNPFYLFDGNGAGSLPGWYLTLAPNEKVITEAFSLGGITIFTALDPREVTNDDGTCSRSGESHIFIVGTVTALGYSIPPGEDISARERATSVPQFTTPPFVEQSATKNPEGGNSGDQHGDFMTDTLEAIMEELKTLQSTRCRYANYTLNIKTIQSDTEMVFIAPVPICIDPTSWKEF